MSEPVLELLLWILLAFFVGCILGCILKMAFGPRTATATSAREMPVPSQPAQAPRRASPSPRPKAPQRPAKPKPGTAAETAPKAERKTEAAADKPERKLEAAAAPSIRGERPKGIPAPRAGQPDKLQRVSGIGPKIERTLHTLGIFHYDQMGGWTEDQVQWIESHLKFKGRIAREKWLEQAKLLADGNEAEFARIYGSEGSDESKQKKAAAPPKRRTPRPPKTTSPV